MSSLKPTHVLPGPFPAQMEFSSSLLPEWQQILPTLQQSLPMDLSPALT